MTRSWVLTLSSLIVPATIAAPAVAADEPRHREYYIGESVPLDQADLKDITAAVLQVYPLVASSPGVKFAHAQRSAQSTDIASVIFYPHTENAGVKQAVQVRCVRQVSATSWNCENPQMRRYLRLSSQEFEVRVSGGISNEGALALIEASRRFMVTTSSIYTTAIQIIPDGDGSLLVSWGRAPDSQDLAMRAHLRAGADQAQPESWQISPFESRGPATP